MNGNIRSVDELLEEDLNPPVHKYQEAMWIRRDTGVLLLVGGALIATSFFVLTPYMAAATFSYTCLVAGVYFRKNRSAHVPLMAMGILIDLGIVLTLEVNRQAVKTALAFSLSPLQQLHIGTSTVATVLYFPIVFLGVMRFFGRGKERSRRVHMRLGIAAFIFRTMGFMLMFSLLWKKS